MLRSELKCSQNPAKNRAEPSQEVNGKHRLRGFTGRNQCLRIVIAIEQVEADREQHQKQRKWLVGGMHQGGEQERPVTVVEDPEQQRQPGLRLSCDRAGQHNERDGQQCRQFHQYPGGPSGQARPPACPVVTAIRRGHPKQAEQHQGAKHKLDNEQRIHDITLWACTSFI